jgi:hypothetical protein
MQSEKHHHKKVLSSAGCSELATPTARANCAKVKINERDAHEMCHSKGKMKNSSPAK